MDQLLFEDLVAWFVLRFGVSPCVVPGGGGGGGGGGGVPEVVWQIILLLWLLSAQFVQSYACTLFGPVVPRGCSEAGFPGCCFGFCLLPQANCWCDENCYFRRDCCDDIRQTCPRGDENQ